MADWSTIISLGVQIPFVLIMAYILDRQAKMFVEVFRFLMSEFKAINEKQADRHREVIESLLGLIDDLASRQNPDKITSRQYKKYQDYLEGELDEPRRREPVR